ncbi:hypothetical protein CCY99_07020 [Helicobacter sp. 16-1353]|uniref:type II secretion system protein n=1 Tax=Helicobacter sp. 16-1353 TaxID=2004996 RepID=UPI000DCD0A87|nr:prepilin-type N-terminal cleavage/methylation domain-containing protein [Helicobacter sp. 16-1353]RAX52714.1 hypothetical protein CCY99_07020 [Helicobacter sp. 16-1353]
MKKAWTMLELVFVIVIIGVLASVAIPRFATNRIDAEVAMARNDISNLLEAIEARVFAENLDPTESAPDGFSNWGEWMMDTGGLDRSRWEARDNTLGPLGDTIIDGNRTNFCGPIIQLDTTTGDLTFDPNQIQDNEEQKSVFCADLKDSYPSGSNRTIPLESTDEVKF